MQRRLTTIVSADMVGYSTLMAADEEGTIRRLRAIRAEIIDPALLANGGRIIKTMGDGLLAEFPSPVQAVQAALAVQTEVARVEADKGDANRIAFRVGINLGDVVIDGDDVLGDGVNIAARLEALADPGGICISNSVFEQVKGKVGAGFVDLGPQQVKNIPDPVQVFAVGPEGKTPLAATRKPKRRAWALLAAALALLALGIGGYLMLLQPRDALADLPEVVADPEAGSLIVLPFEDYSEDGSLDHFADGLTEDLITDLARWKEFRVIARNTAMAYKGQPLDVRKVASETRYVLEGSVRQVGDQMRVTAQLIDGQTGGHLWAERFEETGRDILALQDQVITKIVQTMIGNFGVVREAEYAETWAKAETQLEEYDYYLRGHFHFYRYTPEDNQAAIAVWRDGLRKYPNSGLLKVKLGWGYFMENDLGGSDDPTSLDEILALAKEGLADPGLPPAGHRFGLWLVSAAQSTLGQRAETAKATNKTAISYPFDAESLIHSAADLLYVGEYDRAETSLSRAAELEAPFTDNMNAIYGVLDYVRENCDAAIPKLEIFPYFHANLLFWAGCLAETGKAEKALAALDTLARDFGIEGPEDYPAMLANMPGVVDRLNTQLASVGWPE